MTSRIRILIGVISAGTLVFNGCFPPAPSSAQDIVSALPQRNIVVCDPALLSLSSCMNEVRDHEGKIIKTLPLIHAVVAAFPAEGSLESLHQKPGILRLDADTVHAALGEGEPSNIRRLHAGNFREMGISGKNVRVAVLDTGIEKNHPGLLFRVAGGYDAVSQRDWNDENGHGTHVAGIIAANPDSGEGVAGIAPEANLYAVKVLQSSGSGYASDIIDGINWCIAAGCRIMNMSFGNREYNRSLDEAIRKAYAAGILIIAAAGDQSSSEPVYPAAYDHVLAVSAVDDSEQILPWSSFGAEVDLAAPGMAIYSTYKWKSYATLSGTSMAAAHITGLAALRMEQYQMTGMLVSPDDMMRDLTLSAKDLGTPGWDPGYGYGIPDGRTLGALPLRH